MDAVELKKWANSKAGKRVKSAIADGYTKAKSAIADYREVPSEFSKGVAMQVVQEVRQSNKSRREYLRTGKTQPNPAK